MKKTAILVLLSASLAAQAAAYDDVSEHARKTFEIYRTIVEVDTSKTKGNTPRVARYLADELIAAAKAKWDALFKK